MLRNHNFLEIARDEVLQPDESIGVDENDELDAIDDDLSRNSSQLDLLHCALSIVDLSRCYTMKYHGQLK